MGISEIKKAFGGRLIGNSYVKQVVAETILKLPNDLITFLTKNCWILSSDPEAWAYTFTGADLKDKHLIFLADELFNENTSQIQYTILHEIGHIVLNHKNSINYKQTKVEIDQQELEADQFAKKYI